MTPRRALPAVVLLTIALPAAAQQGAPAEAPASTRVAAVVALRGKGEAAAPALRAALKDPYAPVRSAAVQTIAQELGEKGVPDLVPLLDDLEEGVAVSTALALAGLPGDEAAAATRKALKSPRDRVRSQTAARIGDLRDARFVADLGALVGDPVAAVRGTSVSALRAIGTKETFPFLMQATSDAGPKTAADAVDALGSLGDPRALERVVRLASSESPLVRAAVARTLPALGGVASHGPVALALAGDASESVRLSLVQALRDHPAAEQIPILEKVAADKSGAVRRQLVAAARANPSPAALPLVTARLKDTDPKVRASAAMALAAMKARGELPAVAALSKDAEADVRAACAEALGEYREAEGLATVAALVKDADPSVRGRAVAAAGRIGGEGALAIVEVGVADKEGFVRLEAIRALGVLGGTGARDRLIALAKKEQMPIRLAAIQTLGSLKDKEALPALRELQKDPAEAVRTAARKAIEAIGS